MSYDFHNKIYSNGWAGFIDFIWLWYNRISLILMLAILTIAIVLFILNKLIVEEREQFVQNTNFRKLNRSRVGSKYH